MGHRYIEGCLDMALEDLLASGQSAAAIGEKLFNNEAAEFKQLQILNLVDACIQRLQLFYQQSVQPLIATQPAIHREILVKKNDFLLALETKMNVVLHKLVDCK